MYNCPSIQQRNLYLSPIIKCKPLRHVPLRCYSLCYSVINTHRHTQTHIFTLNIGGRKKELRILPVNIAFPKSSKKKKKLLKQCFLAFGFMFVSDNPLRLQMWVDSDPSGYLVKCVFIHFRVMLVKITSRKWLPRDCQRKAHCTAFLKHILCSTILTWMVVLETNTAQLAIKFPVTLSSLWWEKPRTWALGPGRCRTPGKGADVCGGRTAKPCFS